MEERCETCKYYTPEPDKPLGVCRRYPPQLVATVGQAQNPLTPQAPPSLQPLVAGSSQPVTQPQHWCGEYVVNLVPSNGQLKQLRRS